MRERTWVPSCYGRIGKTLVPVSGISDERRGDPDVPHSAGPDVHRQLHPGEVLSPLFPFVSLSLAFITSKAHRHSIRTLLHNL